MQVFQAHAHDPSGAHATRRVAARISVLAAAVLVACGGGQDSAMEAVDEDVGGSAVVAADHGAGPGRMRAQSLASAAQNAPGFMPTGDPNAQTQGVFGPVVSLPLMPIHQILMPDGRVLFYGSDITGLQGGGLHYAVWDPTLGTGDEAFTVLPTVTATNLFCAGQSLLPDTGDALIIGGTQMIQNVNGFGVADVNVFDRQANTLVASAPMAYRRWYPTLMTLSNGDQVALGGRIDRATSDSGGGDSRQANVDDSGADPASTVASYATTPEYWSKASGWHTLTGADSDDAFGSVNQGWYYPRAWVNPQGKVFVVAGSGNLYQFDPSGNGTLSKYAQTVAATVARTQSVMYLPGKVLSLRTKTTAVTIDINGATPVVKSTAMSKAFRLYGNATLLADGQVWLNGGSSSGNVLTNDFFVSEMWNPSTGTWSDMATATVPRLYHSSSILLPDATVMTGGGGDPGPVTNLNAEIYYPPYLYLKDGTGTPAPRPVITSAPDVLSWGQAFTVDVAVKTPITRVTLIRSGVVTHNFNGNQRFQELKFTQKATALNMTAPTSSGLAPPGYYLLFVFDKNGVPSLAKTIRLGA